MKPMICTISSGIRSRRRPISTSLGSVVAARVSDDITPIVPLATRPHAASRPGSETLRPRTSVRGPVATNGISTANTRNGTSITIRRTT